VREPRAEELANNLAQLREFLIAAIQHEHDLMTAALTNEIEARRESERMIEKARAIQAIRLTLERPNLSCHAPSQDFAAAGSASRQRAADSPRPIFTE